MTFQAIPTTRATDGRPSGAAPLAGPGPSGTRPVSRPVAVPRAGRRRVLVVDDEQDIADLVKHTLERGGDIEVETAARGDAATIWSTVASGAGPINVSGARIRVQATGVGAPVSDRTVMTASPVPREVSTVLRS